MRIAPEIVLTNKEHRKLLSLSRARRQPMRLVQRSKIVLLAAKGLENREIARRLNVGNDLVSRWRRRFAIARLAGIEKDAPRPGRTPSIAPDLVEKIVSKTTQEKPASATHWSQRSMAKAVGVSPATIARVWHSHGLRPHLSETFKLSNDPRFTEKLRDVVGLYLNPPEHAIVLCADEKSQIQALDRTQLGLPLKRGRSATMTHDYVRHGTTTLFAALNTLDGTVISTCQERHRHGEWLKFLRLIDKSVPANLEIHLIADNYRTHKHDKVQRWLARHKRFHMHFTPTSASWLNMVERFFRDLTTKRIRRGTFASIDQLIAAIGDYIEHHNADPKPIIWTAKADDILEKVTRARATLNKQQSV